MPVELGFGARQVRDVLPHAVVEMDAPDDLKAKLSTGGPIYGVQSEAIIAALVNAVRTLTEQNVSLSARIGALETTKP